MGKQVIQIKPVLGTILLGSLVLSLLQGGMDKLASAAALRAAFDGDLSVGWKDELSPSGMTIGAITVQTPGPIEKFGKFETSFDIVNTVASNPYFPYDGSAPAGVENGTGITVDALLLPPGVNDWSQAQILPCFYYQPVEQVGSGATVDLLPTGKAEWRCRFTPQVVGDWQYKVRATDASGTTTSQPQLFTCVDSARKGFVRVSSTDPKSFEFSDGTPFVTPLINTEQSSPFNGLARLRDDIQKFGENGVRFIRWFPTGEGANYSVIPFGDDLRSSWGFGSAWSTLDDVDVAAGKRLSFMPYYYTSQQIPAVPRTRYRLSLRAKVTGDKVFRPQLSDDTTSLGELTLCAKSGLCPKPAAGWNDYTLYVTTTVNAETLSVNLRDGFSEDDNVQGTIRLQSLRLQRDETGHGDWGPNLLTRSDPDTYNYVDQHGAALLDEVLRLSERYSVYHKLTLFHKNDNVLNRFLPDGSLTEDWDSSNDYFYSQDGQAGRWYQRAYTRYFVARWSYSPALHSLELANENMLSQPSYDAAFALAQYVRELSPRHILMSNSFWGWFVNDFWSDPVRGYLMDYADKHWYANKSGAGEGELIGTITNDSAANVRECWSQFRDYGQWFDYSKPIVRGETGVAVSGTEPQDPDIARDTQGTYYHKQLWAQVGSVGYQCDGEWYPMLLDDHNLWGMFAAYERFMQGEPLTNGKYEAIGTDLDDSRQISATSVTGSLRAWGARDIGACNVLLWIDNSQHTWRHVVDRVVIPAASATLALQGLITGTYTAEWWNTTTGATTTSKTYTVMDDHKLVFSVGPLATDVAVKFKCSTPNQPLQVYLPLVQR